MKKRIQNVLKQETGAAYIDYVVGILVLMLIIAFMMQLLPVFTTKQNLDLFATELVRAAEINGNTNVGNRVTSLQNQTGLTPTIKWNASYHSGTKVQLNNDIDVECTCIYDIGFFNFGSFPITLKAQATGKSEVYYK